MSVGGRRRVDGQAEGEGLALAGRLPWRDFSFGLCFGVRSGSSKAVRRISSRPPAPRYSSRGPASQPATGPRPKPRRSRRRWKLSHHFTARRGWQPAFPLLLPRAGRVNHLNSSLYSRAEVAAAAAAAAAFALLGPPRAALNLLAARKTAAVEKEATVRH